jgi:hypothetical protein
MTRYSSRDRAEEAVKLRAREYTWQEIADRLGFSQTGAGQAIPNACQLGQDFGQVG